MHSSLRKSMANYPVGGNAESALSFAIQRHWAGAPQPASSANKSVVLLGLLCALGLSACVYNRAAPARSHAAVMYALPKGVKSLPVRIVPSFEHRVLAWSTVSMMDSYVSYNPRVAEKLPPEVLAFALVHEYGHLCLNHIQGFGFGKRSAAAIKQQELDADYFAARFWATNDARVAQVAAESFLSPAASRALRSENPSGEAGYPTRTERAHVIIDCLAEAQRVAAVKSP